MKPRPPLWSMWYGFTWHEESFQSHASHQRFTEAFHPVSLSYTGRKDRIRGRKIIPMSLLNRYPSVLSSNHIEYYSLTFLTYFILEDINKCALRKSWLNWKRPLAFCSVESLFSDQTSFDPCYKTLKWNYKPSTAKSYWHSLCLLKIHNWGSAQCVLCLPCYMVGFLCRGRWYT